MISSEQLAKARENLAGLQPNVSTLTIKAAIENLRPDIDRKLKAGLSYKEIGAAVFDGLGLETGEVKRENFWRSVVRFHKAAGKKAAKTAKTRKRKAAKIPAGEEADQVQATGWNGTAA